MLLCPYGLSKGDLKIVELSQARKLVNKCSFTIVWQVSLGNTEPTVATGV
jgi:hypothetical protein